MPALQGFSVPTAIGNSFSYSVNFNNVRCDTDPAFNFNRIGQKTGSISETSVSTQLLKKALVCKDHIKKFIP
jgi:hypothetical protein